MTTDSYERKGDQTDQPEIASEPQMKLPAA